MHGHKEAQKAQEFRASSCILRFFVAMGFVELERSL